MFMGDKVLKSNTLNGEILGVYYDRQGTSNSEYKFDMKRVNRGSIILKGNLSYSISVSNEQFNPQNWMILKEGTTTTTTYEVWNEPWSWMKITITTNELFGIWLKGNR